MGSFLIFLGLVLTVFVIVEAYIRYRKRRKLLALAKCARYCATAGSVVSPDYSASVDLSGNQAMSLLLVGVIAAMMGYGVIISYNEFISGPPLVDKKMAWLFVVIWLCFVAIFWRTLLSLRDLLHERRLYLQTQGKEIVLQEDDLYLSLMLFAGAGRDLLLLQGKPYFRIPLKEVTAFRADPAPVSNPVTSQDYIQVCFADSPEGYHISRLHLERHEDELLLILKSKLRVPPEL